MIDFFQRAILIIYTDTKACTLSTDEARLLCEAVSLFAAPAAEEVTIIKRRRMYTTCSSSYFSFS